MGTRPGSVYPLSDTISTRRPAVLVPLGRLAELGELALFRDVVLASASIPGALPPVPIEVEAAGERFTELHVDGGVTRTVVIGPSRAEELLPRDLPFPVDRTIYVVVNLPLAPTYEPVEDRLRAIVGRSITTLIRSQAEGDVLRIDVASGAAGADFRLTFLPPTFAAPQANAFDRAYMTALFETGYDEARNGIDWLERAPAVIGRRELERARAAEDGPAGAPAGGEGPPSVSQSG